MMSDWISVKKRSPKRCMQYLCYLYSNDMGGYCPWFQVLYFDIHKKSWCENDPLSCVKGTENYLSNWHSVTHWKEIETPK